MISELLRRLAFAAAFFLVVPIARSEMAPDDVVRVSDLWAAKSREFLSAGRRDDALAAALKGLPAADADRPEFAAAYRALRAAFVARRSVLPGFTSSDFSGFDVSPDGRYGVLSEGIVEKTVKTTLFDLRTASAVKQLQDEVVPQPNAVFARDSATFAMILGGRKVAVIDSGTGRSISSLPVQVQKYFAPLMTLSSDDRVITIPDGESDFLIADYPSLVVKRRVTAADIRKLGAIRSGIYNAALTANGSGQACLTISNARSYDMDEGQTGVLFARDTSSPFEVVGTLSHTTVQRVACSPDGRYVGIVHHVQFRKYFLSVFDTTSKQPLVTFQPFPFVDGGLPQIAFIREGRYMVVSYGEVPRWYDLERRQLVDNPFDSAGNLHPTPGIYGEDGSLLRVGSARETEATLVPPKGPALVSAALRLLPGPLVEEVEKRRLTAP